MTLLNHSPKAELLVDEAVIRDLASNEESNDVAEVVRRHYRVGGSLAQYEVDLLALNRENVADVDRGTTIPRILPKRAAQVASYHALQQWEGHVTAIRSDNMIAELVDLTMGGTRASEQVEIDLAELGHEDRENLRLGSVFRWTIGYETSRASPKRRFSQLIFRQMPVWTKVELDAAVRKAEDRHNEIEWD